MKNQSPEYSVSTDSAKTELNIYKHAHPIKSLADGRANLKMFKPRGIICAIPSSSRRREPKDQSLRETET